MSFLYSKCKDGQRQDACDILSKLCAELKTAEVCSQMEAHQAWLDDKEAQAKAEAARKKRS